MTLLFLLVQSLEHPNGREQFDKILIGLLRRILDTNKRVQEAACSAFATLEEVIYLFSNCFPTLRSLSIISTWFLFFRRLQKNSYHDWKSFCSTSCVHMENIRFIRFSTFIVCNQLTCITCDLLVLILCLLLSRGETLGYCMMLLVLLLMLLEQS